MGRKLPGGLSHVPAVAADDRYYKDTSIDPTRVSSPSWAIFGKTLDSTLARGIGLRSSTGIHVLTTTGGNEDGGAALRPVK